LLQAEQELTQAGLTPDNFKRTQLAIKHIEESLKDLSVSESTVDNFKGTILQMNKSILELNQNGGFDFSKQSTIERIYPFKRWVC